ncbi:MAG: glycosyltransferase family 1 protein, partial [Verrucomicrobia bacterium]|nr:glycosyltransferase family 1 protein [Verrucomicrobiota bacterium]
MKQIVLGSSAPRRIGFISTRFAGTDGVTLEADKWAQILSELGHSSFWMAGHLDTPPEASHLAPLAFFGHPDVVEVQKHLFGKTTRSRAVSNQVQAIKEQLKDELYRFIEKFQIEVLIPENLLAIPMHVPL